MDGTHPPGSVRLALCSPTLPPLRPLQPHRALTPPQHPTHSTMKVHAMRCTRRARLVASAAKDSATSSVPRSSPTHSPNPSSSSGPWAHPIPTPEKGCLLLAHPMMFHSNQEYFFQAVILLLEHNDKGSYGIILNRPTLVRLLLICRVATCLDS